MRCYIEAASGHTAQQQECDGYCQWGLREKAKFITKLLVEAWPVVDEILETTQL